MKRFIYLLLFSACICMYCVPVYGWGQEGHRIIAKIAYDHLDGKARKRVDQMLGKQGMVYWSNWADEIKSDTIYPQSIRDGWHYQDFAPGMSFQELYDCWVFYPTEGGSLFRALDSIELVLRAGKGDAHTLRFFIHLRGDLYCPMHMAHMDDKGGNAVKMGWFSKNNNTNLHAVWDTKLIESQGYSYTEYAEKLEHEYAYQRKSLLGNQFSEEELVWQTYLLTEDIYAYQERWDGNTYHYIYHWRQPMEYQLYVAGMRLAKCLNEIF